MSVLYVFPHPDDESFGPGHAMASLGLHGHKVHLLTLTRGGATRQRHKFGYSVEEMGEIRYHEMLGVQKALGLAGMTVLDHPDSGLSELDPRVLERDIRAEIERIRPSVIVTYPVHGISGFPDHLVTHAVVKRVFCELRKETDYVRRLAFTTITEDAASHMEMFRLTGSKQEVIDCILTIDDKSIRANHAALDCYVTYRETVEKSGIKRFIIPQAVFEFFDEDFTPPVTDLFDQLP